MSELVDLSVPWWEFILRAVVVYGAVLAMLRLSGMRQVGQFSPFDMVLLLLLANAVQNAINAGDNSLLGGLISAAVLVGLNYLIGWATFHSKRVERMVEGEPQVLIHNGHVVKSSLARNHITDHELNEALREAGCQRPGEVRLGILEVDGAISVIPYHR